MRARKSLYFFVFLVSLGLGTASPIVPLYARHLGANYTGIGLLGTALGMAHVAFAVPLGLLSDRVGRKILLFTGGLLASTAAGGYVLATHVSQLLGLRFIEGLSLATFLPATEAFATELAGTRMVGITMGWVSAAYNAGFAGGSFIGGSVTEWLGFRATFAIYVGMALAAVIATLSLRNPEPPHADPIAPSVQMFSERHTWRNRHAMLGYLTGAIHIFDLGVVTTFLPVYARSLGLTISATGLLFSLFWLTRMVASLGAGSLSDRVGRHVVLAVALLSSGAGFVIVGFGRAAWMFPAVIIIGLGLGSSFPVGIALVSDHVPRAQRGLAMGIFETAGGATLMVGTAVGGYLADRLDPRAPYLIALTLSAVGAVLQLRAARLRFGA